MMTAERLEALAALCRTFRRDVLTAIYEAQSGHPGGSLSVCEILTALYFEHLRVYPQDPAREDQDRLVLCKGHAAPMLYRVLAERGYFPVSEFMTTLRRLDSRMQGHPSIHTPGVDMPSGPLGIGMGAAQGMAMGMKLKGLDQRAYAVLGDGELNEGAVWETAMSAPKSGLHNLIAIVDRNNVQLDGTVEEIMPTEPLADKWRAFGWNVLECDGHDLMDLDRALTAAKAEQDKPSVILARTVKGKGVSFMEGKNTWHGKVLSREDYEAAMEELGGEAQ